MDKYVEDGEEGKVERVLCGDGSGHALMESIRGVAGGAWWGFGAGGGVVDVMCDLGGVTVHPSLSGEVMKENRE